MPTAYTQVIVLVARRSGNALCPTNEVALRRACWNVHLS